MIFIFLFVFFFFFIFFFFLMIRRPPRSTLDRSSAASDVYKRQEKQMTLVGEDIISMVPQPSGVRRDISGWIDDVIGRCVEPQIESRFSDAKDLSLSLIHISEPTRPY